MQQNQPLFEEMLAGYPAEKRELARAAYIRFVDGDTAHFFTQLFLLLDVYANYANRIPLAMKAANADTLTTLNDIREEIGILAQTVETKSVNLGNATEQTSALCLATQQKCETAAQRLAKLTKEIGQQVDTTAIVESIRKSVDAGVRAEVITPFMQRTEELSASVMPTLEKIRDASEEAARVWPGRIWKMALACGLVLGLAVAIVGTSAAYFKIKRHYDRTLAEQIASTEKTLAQNQSAFRELAVANVPVRVVRASDGNTLRGGYAVVIEGIYTTEERTNQNGKEGIIYFSSQRKESELESIQREVQDAYQKMKEAGK
jgi:hypothetical protein